MQLLHADNNKNSICALGVKRKDQHTKATATQSNKRKQEKSSNKNSSTASNLNVCLFFSNKKMLHATSGKLSANRFIMPQIALRIPQLPMLPMLPILPMRAVVVISAIVRLFAEIVIALSRANSLRLLRAPIDKLRAITIGQRARCEM
uniref:Uncharacterized protein n=1 Tax=Ceratitis capitata TaxID=7213 RepID=W8AZC1_CERCA